jgi:hemerythrin-like domain-containing protein
MTTTRVNVAAWIRSEHEKVDRLTVRLHEAIAFVPRVVPRTWLAELRERFEHFRAHMHQHMALEEHNEYMADVLERLPTLANKVERLRREHRSLARLLDDLHRTLAEIDPQDQLLVVDCCHRIDTILGYVAHHEDDENDLVEFAFTDDIGTKD